MQTSSLTIIKLFLLYLLVNKKNAKKKGIKKKNDVWCRETLFSGVNSRLINPSDGASGESVPDQNDRTSR